ncbi:metal transporter [Mycoplasma sp. CSL10137]|uniref:ZIP family metal transporter n=1 Tax=unclassified Mycoplasma TaxID=2683645 RepID=UPI00197C0615|nr:MULTISPECIES: ZIP family metal transporter [unclassified Mycoplasma]MBN4083516.1 metal transporter [Mycoplasma sp. CSL10137]MBN4084554.1 metal transporter [Mycoplasma sp. CSL10166]MBU4693032.1 ZIP family metal transporter [Mycoplasma sp. CSL7491-lung]
MNWIYEIYKGINSGIQNDSASKIILVLIFLLILLSIPTILSITLPFAKKLLNSNIKVYLYAFSTGFFIILATFGFLRESIEQSSLYAFNNNFSTNKTYLYNIFLVGGGSLLGLIIAIVIKFVISYKLNQKLMKSKKLSVFIHEHNHSDGEIHHHSHEEFMSNKDDRINLVEDTIFVEKVEKKLKIIALLLLLTHRIPEGLLIGYSLSQNILSGYYAEMQLSDGGVTTLTAAYLFSLILHLIPEELIFYVRLRESGFSPLKSLMISFLGLSLFLPFMIIGVFVNIGNEKYINSLIYSTIGTIFIFTSLVEFLPEFYHWILNKRKYFFVILMMFIGILFAIFVLSFHSHSH